jgi:hypothetical protein
MAKKKHAPHKQLVRAGKMAHELLAEKGIILPQDKSAIDRILQTANAPTLPGTPAYLPYPWTINASRRILYDLTREWQNENKNDQNKLNDITQYFKFIIRALRDEEKTIDVKIHLTVQEKKYDFKLLHQKDAIKGIRKLMVDSFAVSIIAKSNSDTVTYLDWFHEWTDNLLKQWGEKSREIK